MRRRSYRVLVRDTDRLRRLVEDLLDFGRFEAGAATLRLETLDVAALVRSTVADFQERAAQDGFTVELTGARQAVSVEGTRSEDAAANSLWLVPVNGGQPRKLEIDVSGWIVGQGIRLHPSGKQIAYSTGQDSRDVWALESIRQMLNRWK